MKSQLNDIKAALLFLLIYQFQESDGEPTTPTSEENAKALIWLEDNGYIPSWKTLILFDNDGIPKNISWQNSDNNMKSYKPERNFPQTVYEAVDYNPYWFHPDNRKESNKEFPGATNL